ncbi:hypothetical protein PoB_005905600 [Plakobranchus ocellatus]|uniref:Uncharacterized protein n=1 Tax=Plakobranchus ocellatus TaxID=259542 RepID=A0AAV4CLH3_9GAST|nr:hypothetical protein PoB_005905600 [Plakobranchus ocellatus]
MYLLYNRLSGCQDSMKVIIKFDNRTEIVENVSVDEKCFPLVEGVHPYPKASEYDSTLANQSSLWFKTLAIDCIFVDCDKGEVHWFPVVNDANPDVELILRKGRPDHHDSSFILSIAKPLFEDTALYEMDPSLKGMMLTCSEAMKKLYQRKLPRVDFNRAIAGILHVYILPSISFSAEDLYCLSRTRCLIEERVNNTENMIKCVVDSIDRLESCLSTLRTNLLFRENLESESYLLTCSPQFLHAFVKNLEEVVVNLNLSLEAQQSKVNWAKQREDDPEKISELKQKRDEIHMEVQKLIQVREAIRNVTTRKDFVSPKKSKRRRKSVVVASCFHDVFVEVARRIDAENKILEHLCQDKLNISAAREATMAAIMNLENNNRTSDRNTTFEPEEFVDYSINLEHETKKSDLWPTFQERVAAILDNSLSKSHQAHLEGCKALSSRIDLALSEFHLAMVGNPSDEAESCNGLKPSVERVQMRKSTSSEKSRSMRSAVCTWNGEPIIHDPAFHSALNQTVEKTEALSLDQESDSRKSLKDNSQTTAVQDTQKVDIVGGRQGTDADNTGQASTELVPNLRRDRYQQRVHEKLALSSLMQTVEQLKQVIQAHFREVVTCLGQELGEENELSLDKADQRELVWKSYERIFMRTQVQRLRSLYETLLRSGTQRTYAMLCASSLHALLGEDKIVQLFYGPKDGSSSIDCPAAKTMPMLPDHFSMAKTLSEVSMDVRHCPIEDLYKLANADSSDIQHRFHLESSGEDSDLPSSPDSSPPSVQMYRDSVEFARKRSGRAVITHTAISSSHRPAGLDNKDKDSLLSPDQIHVSFETPDGQLPAADVPESQKSESPASPFLSSNSLNAEDDAVASKLYTRSLSTSSQAALLRLDTVLSPFRKSICKCMGAVSLLDKARYIGRAIQGLHHQVWQLLGEDEHASCDDILSMLVTALFHMPEDIFIGLYVDVRMLMDIWPSFLDGTLWNCSLVNLYASYDFLFTHKVCEKVLQDFHGSLRIKF